MLKIQNYNIGNNITLTADILSAYINNFWKEVYAPLHNKNAEMHLMLMCKVEFTDPTLGFRSLAELRKVNFSDRKLFIEYLVSSLSYLNESYKVNAISKITFSYIVKDGVASGDRMLLQNVQYEVSVHKYNNIQLPLTMDISKYGEIIGTLNIEKGIKYTVLNNNSIFIIDVTETQNTVIVNGPRNLKFVDTKLTDTSFQRVINKDTLFIMNGELIVKSKEINMKPFKTVNTDKILSKSNNIMTIDIETVNIGGSLKPYCICAYSNKFKFGSYAESINQNHINKMFSDFITALLNTKSIKYVYAHNLSGFDGIFLIKQLIAYTDSKVEPLIHNGKIISIKFIHTTFVMEGNIRKKVIRTIIFKDSLLLLPMNLRKLCKAFNVYNAKGFFPVLFNEDINYVGSIPLMKYWPGITHEEWDALYEQYGDNWNFKHEAIKYCMLDCESLFEVLIKFNELVFKEFKINIHGSLTLPALAMKIYKSNFMPKGVLSQLHGLPDRDIRQSYTGGAVDVYIPHNMDLDTGKFSKLFYYDVNSLYPYVMSTLEMPIGKPQAFEGNIRDIDSNAQGFFYCDITSPEYLEHPILQRRIKTSSGVRTIAGLGSWNGWISSLEFDKAIKLGYKIEIIRGYQFKTANIFKEYIEKMYELRLHYNPGDPMNLIAKLLMNSLYGKFGMKTDHNIVEIFNSKDEQESIVLNNRLESFGELVSDHIQLGHHVIMT
jgi:DNA polymerase type B, organellar and viral